MLVKLMHTIASALQTLVIVLLVVMALLVVAAVALLISSIRKGWYVQYMAAFEAAAECVLEKANKRRR